MMELTAEQREHSRGEDGFTLIEVIVTLVLLALILSMMPGAFRLGHRAWEVAGVLDRGADEAGTRSFLEQRLAEAMPLYEGTRSGILKVAFEGRPSGVTFVAPAPSGSKGAGLYQYRIELRPGPGGSSPALWLEQSLYKLGGVGASDPIDNRILIADATGASFRYYGRPEPKADPEWREEWTRPDTIPDLIELKFGEHRGGLTMQPLMVELKMKALP